MKKTNTVSKAVYDEKEHKLPKAASSNKADPTVPKVESNEHYQKVLKTNNDEEDQRLTLSSQWLYFQPGV